MTPDDASDAAGGTPATRATTASYDLTSSQQIVVTLGVSHDINDLSFYNRSDWPTTGLDHAPGTPTEG